MHDEFDFETERAREWLGLDREPLGWRYWLRTTIEMTVMSFFILVGMMLAGLLTLDI